MSRGFSLLVCLLLPIAAASAADFFKSNELGMELAPIPESKTAGIEWVLEVERTGKREVKRLTQNGEAYGRWVITYQGGRVASESVYRKGELASVTDYRSGHPTRQTEYTAGKPSTVRVYSYAGSLLKSVSVYDGSGTLLYRDLYSEGRDGRMRRAVRETPDGKRKTISLTFSGDSLVSEWVGAGGTGELLHYSGGSLASTEQWKGTDLLSEETVTPSANGSVKVSTDFKTGAVTRRSYDKKGDILSEVEAKDGETIRTVDYTYSDGRLSTKLTKTPGRREQVRYEYDSSGALSMSTTTVNRQLAKVIHYTGKDTYLEDLYLNGALVLHAYYEKGKLVRELPAEGAPSSADRGGG